MPGLLDPISLLLFAQDAGAAGGGPEGGGGGLLPLLLPFALVFVAFWLLIIRPQQKQQKQLQELIASLKKNDRVVTQAGIYGTVVSIDDKSDRVVLRIDDEKGVKLTCRKTSIVGVLNGGETASEADKEKSAAS